MSAGQAAIIDAYHAAFDAPLLDDASLGQLRFAVLDCETTGLDPRRDAIISVGAVAVQDGEILLFDGIELLLQVRYNTAATPVHGITRHAARGGLGEAEAMLATLDYLGNAVIVGHHIGHDIAMLNAALERQFGFELANRHLDTGLLSRGLGAVGAFDPPLPEAHLSLDVLCERFRIAPNDRHTAAGDAFLTAQLFLRLLRISARMGHSSLGALLALQSEALGLSEC